jgi:hypothetical protein
MRLIFLVLSALLLAQCASRGEDGRFRVGQSLNALVVIGVAEAADEREPAYTMLWRQVAPTGVFADYHGRTTFEPRTNADNSLRIDGIPGEFAVAEVEPGTYALDSVFAVLRENGLIYYAQGVVTGPSRPSFEVRAGEAVYLGIWETRVSQGAAETRLWRLSEDDMDAVVRAARAVSGEVRLRDTNPSEVPCQPRQLNNMSQRQVC